VSKRIASWLAWSLAALSLALFAATIAFYILTPSPQPPSSWGTGGLVGTVLIFVPYLAFPIVGTLIASRRPQNPVGWICLADGLVWMLGSVTGAYGEYGLLGARPGSVPFPAEIGALTEWLWVPAVGLLGIYLPLLFPDGRLPSRRWRPLAWLAGVVIALASVGMVVLVLLPLCILASALSLILRYRRSGDEEREQIKWLAFAASLVGLGLLGAGAGGSIFAPETTGTKPLWLGLLEDVVLLSYASIPVAVGFAVLKYRLYDIDVVINRTLIYGSLTLMLALLYLGSVTALQSLFSLLTGQGNTLAIVATTLAIAALFNPLRRRIQSFIDRRFYRRKYDARNTLEAFGSRLRDETDLERIAEDLAEVVDETMQPSHISLWLSSFPSSSANSSESSSEVRSSSKQSEPPSQ